MADTTLDPKPLKNRTYQRTSDGVQFVYVGAAVGEFTRGWECLGPNVHGLILGDPWNFPIGYKLMPEEVAR
jgi:hypothetical protein